MNAIFFPQRTKDVVSTVVICQARIKYFCNLIIINALNATKMFGRIFAERSTRHSVLIWNISGVSLSNMFKKHFSVCTGTSSGCPETLELAVNESHTGEAESQEKLGGVDDLDEELHYYQMKDNDDEAFPLLRRLSESIPSNAQDGLSLQNDDLMNFAETTNAFFERCTSAPPGNVDEHETYLSATNFKSVDNYLPDYVSSDFHQVCSAPVERTSSESTAVETNDDIAVLNSSVEYVCRAVHSCESLCHDTVDHIEGGSLSSRCSIQHSSSSFNVPSDPVHLPNHQVSSDSQQFQSSNLRRRFSSRALNDLPKQNSIEEAYQR